MSQNYFFFVCVLSRYVLNPRKYYLWVKLPTKKLSVRL